MNTAETIKENLDKICEELDLLLAQPLNEEANPAPIKYPTIGEAITSFNVNAERNISIGLTLVTWFQIVRKNDEGLSGTIAKIGQLVVSLHDTLLSWLELEPLLDRKLTVNPYLNKYLVIALRLSQCTPEVKEHQIDLFCEV